MTAITILETAESYVNILLGDYKEPEVVVQLKEGRFLISKYSNNGRKHNHELVSPCTRQAVSAVLRSESRAVHFTFNNIRIYFIIPPDKYSILNKY